MSHKLVLPISVDLHAGIQLLYPQCREAEHSWPPDPVFTESNWPLGTPAAQFYLRESTGVDAAVLGAGCAVTALSIVLALGSHFAWEKRKKMD